ncbi:MAG: endolytic transglycosylase MltG, partial [Pyrinomonadaceae bacterium]
MIKKLLILLTILFFAAIMLFAGGSIWIQRSMATPKEHDKTGQYISIEKGSTPSQIVAKLENEGIISNAMAVRIYLRTLGDASKLKAGDYRFLSPVTPLQVLAQLEKGEERSTRLVIPEGFTKFDIAKRITDWSSQRPVGSERISPNEQVDEKAILELMNDTSLIRDISPEAKDLEGYMYPSTYDVAPDATPEKIIKIMVEQFRKIWKPEWTERAKAIGHTPHEIVTIASLIETETGVTDERPIVASVIYNRLSKGIPLGIDMTNI